MEVLNLTLLYTYTIFTTLLIPVILSILFTNKRFKLVHNYFCELGSDDYKGSKVFNLSLIIFGLLSTVIGINISNILPNIPLTKIAQILLILISIGTVLLGVIKVNDKKSFHDDIAKVSMSLVFLVSVYTIFAIKPQNYFETTTFILSIIISVILPVVGYFSLLDRKGIFKYTAGFQWVSVLATIGWNISTAVSIIMRIS